MMGFKALRRISPLYVKSPMFIAKRGYFKTGKREHSRKPDEQYSIIEECSWGPFLELFGRGGRQGWTVWGDAADADYKPSWKIYSYNSRVSSEYY